METLLTLIRHGETSWNRERRWQGQADVPLNELGRHQAVLLADRLSHDHTHQLRFDYLYTSDLSRALETAEIVGRALALKVHPLLELREMHVGIWSGLSSTEIAERYAADWARIQAGEDLRRGEHGESREMLRLRVVTILEHLVAQHPGQHLAVVTHGGVVHALMDHCDALGVLALPRPKRIENTSLSQFAVAGDRWRVVALNDAAHLEGTDRVQASPGETL